METKLEKAYDTIRATSNRITQLYERIKELERESAKYIPLLAYIARECTTDLSEFKKWLEKRDLETEIKARESSYNLVFSNGCTNSAVLLSEIDRLKEKLKLIKGGDL